MISYWKKVDEESGEYKETKLKGKKTLPEFMKGPYKSMVYPKFKDTIENLPEPETCPVPKVK